MVSGIFRSGKSNLSQWYVEPFLVVSFFLSGKLCSSQW